MFSAVPRAVLLLFVAVALASGACARKKPPAVVAMEPRPNPPVGRAAAPDNPRERLRQNRWLAQFWEELTPAQRRRVEARMQRARPPLASGQEGAGVVWDGLGLAERDRLVFGSGAIAVPAPARSAAAAAGEGESPPPSTP